MSIEKEIILHSFLLTGPNPSVNYQRALELASLFLETSAVPGKTPDLFLLAPESVSTNLKIDQIRQLKKDLTSKPLVQPIKVALIHQAHQLTRAAQNALLKTLEEPPGKTKIIITSDQPGSLLETIISRCQTQAETKPTSLTEDQFNQTEEIATRLISESVAGRLSWSQEQNLTRDQLTNWIVKQLYFWHQQLVKPNNFSQTEIFSALQALVKAAKLIKTQVNHHLVFDQLLIAFPGPRIKKGVAKDSLNR